MILCDTNIFIEIFKNNDRIDEVLNDIGHSNVSISDVVLAELFFGARNKWELQGTIRRMKIYHSFPILPDIAALALKLVENYCLSHKLHFMDALIAATAIINRVELYTLNVKDFTFIPNLRLFQP